MAAKRPPNRTTWLPDGTEVLYWDAIGVDGNPQQRRYKIGETKLVAISTVAGIFEKWALTPAAVRLTEAGVIALAGDGVNLATLDPEQLRGLMKQRGLYFDSIWEQARIRGDIAHDHLLHLIRDGQVARLSDFAVDIRAWISAGMRYAQKAKPKIIDAETIVASAEHGVGGRYDLFAELRDGRRARIDFKTVTEWKTKRNSKGEDTGQLYPPYDENAIQLDGYELTARGCGMDEADCLMVVRLGPDGDYDVTEVPYRPDVFEAALSAHRARKQVWKQAEPVQEVLA